MPSLTGDYRLIKDGLVSLVASAWDVERVYFGMAPEPRADDTLPYASVTMAPVEQEWETVGGCARFWSFDVYGVFTIPAPDYNLYDFAIDRFDDIAFEWEKLPVFEGVAVLPLAKSGPIVSTPDAGVVVVSLTLTCRTDQAHESQGPGRTEPPLTGPPISED